MIKVKEKKQDMFQFPFLYFQSVFQLMKYVLVWAYILCSHELTVFNNDSVTIRVYNQSSIFFFSTLVDCSRIWLLVHLSSETIIPKLIQMLNGAKKELKLWIFNMNITSKNRNNERASQWVKYFFLTLNNCVLICVFWIKKIIDDFFSRLYETLIIVHK